MSYTQRKIFSGDPAYVGIILLVALWCITVFLTPAGTLTTEAEPILMTYHRGH